MGKVVTAATLERKNGEEEMKWTTCGYKKRTPSLRPPFDGHLFVPPPPPSPLFHTVIRHRRTGGGGRRRGIAALLLDEGSRRERGGENFFSSGFFQHLSLPQTGAFSSSDSPFLTSARCWAARRGSSQKGRRKRGEKSGPGRIAGAEKGKKKKRQRRLFFSPFSGPSFSLSERGKEAAAEEEDGGRKVGHPPPRPFSWLALARARQHERNADGLRKKRGGGGKGGGGEDYFGPLLPLSFPLLSSFRPRLSLSLEGRRREIRGGLEIDKKGKKRGGNFAQALEERPPLTLRKEETFETV